MVNTQKASRSISDKVIVRLLLWTAFSLFLFNEPVRTMFNKSSFNSSFNLLYMCLGILTIGVLVYKACVDIRITLVALAFLGVAMITLAAAGTNFLFRSCVVISTMFIPFLTSGIRLPESILESFLVKFIKAVNTVCITLVGIGVIDYFSGAVIQVFFAQHHIFENDQARMVLLERAAGIYRYYSFIGGPLTNAGYMLIFYTLNILYNRHFKTLLNEYFMTFVSAIGLVLCGSRSALIIGFLMFLLLNNRKHKIGFSFSFLILNLGLASTAMFKDNLMKRFIIGAKSGDFSEGRNEALARVLSGFVNPPEFFTGNGVGYSRQVTLMMGGFINSFEYPVMMFAYDFGILGTFLIYTLVLIIPGFIALKNKSYDILIFFLTISLYVNGYNDLSNYTDYMGQFCFFTMVMVNMSYLLKKRREEGVEH